MTIRAYKLGALGQDDLTGVKCLSAILAAAAPNYMTLEYPTGTDYQVPAGKTFYITKMDFHGNATDQHAIILIGYGDDGVADGAAAPTNFKALTANYYVNLASNTTPFDVIIPIPAEKYPCIKISVGTCAITVYGIEV